MHTLGWGTASNPVISRETKTKNGTFISILSFEFTNITYYFKEHVLFLGNLKVDWIFSFHETKSSSPSFHGQRD